MKTSKLINRVIVSTLLISSIGCVLAQEPDDKKSADKPTDDKPKVQIALLLDTSNSMDGLIDQARTQLWKIVNEFAGAKVGAQAPELEIALFEYGNSSLSMREQWVRCVRPFSKDLDTLSRELFSLKTNGGDEYCGAVIKKCVDQLSWDHSAKTYKAIFIAGNEPFTQGDISSSRAVTQAKNRGIIVNTIHCGNDYDGISGGWKQGAELAGGGYFTINQDEKVAHVPTPYDQEIAELSNNLNRTYLGYGAKRKQLAQEQLVQDKNAVAAAPAVAVERAKAKSSHLYSNAAWDLVDLKKEGKNLSAIPKNDLPHELQNLNEQELEAAVAAKAQERAEIQEKIKTLSAQREKYLANNTPKTESAALDTAVIKAIRTQAATKGCRWE